MQYEQRVEDVFGSNELVKAADIPHGRSIPCMIENAIVRDFDDGKKIELSFRGKQKRLIVNKTNARSIATVLQTDVINQWIGRTIFILRTKTDFQGRQVDCIRVDENPPVRAASQLPPTPQEQAGMADFEAARQQAAADAEAFPNSGDDCPF